MKVIQQISKNEYAIGNDITKFEIVETENDKWEVLPCDTSGYFKGAVFNNREDAFRWCSVMATEAFILEAVKDIVVILANENIENKEKGKENA